MYKNIFVERVRGEKNTHTIHLWTDSGYEKTKWINPAYKECHEADATHIGLNGHPLKKTTNYYYNPYGNKDQNDKGIHFADIKAHQKFLIEKYGTNDEPSTTHSELFFDIETEMLDSLTEEGIREAPKMVTSIAWYDKQAEKWGILILDIKNQLHHHKFKNKEIIPVQHESDLLYKWVEKMEEIRPDILIGYNSDHFDIPYLYYRTCNVLGKDMADRMSPIGKVTSSLTRHKNTIKSKNFQEVDIKGISSLDYMRMHKKYSWADEPSWKLDAIGEKYAGINKIEYEGNLDTLFKNDIQKFIQYNFVDVEILVKLDENLEYLSLTKNIAHKGKHLYHEIYANTVTQDGAISAYLLSKGIVPPNKDPHINYDTSYAGGYLFCPKAGIYNYVFDEDLTSLYPCIIMSLNIGKETLMGYIVDADDRNNRLGLNDLKKMEPNKLILIKNSKNKRAELTVSQLIKFIESNKWTISANGTMYATDRQSVLSTILAKWFGERVKYKNEMKKAYKSKNKELGAKFHMKQYTMKILLNSLYGATALSSFRYGNRTLSKSITLTGQRIIQESALCANRSMNKEIKGELC
jgi:DNA polymerase elongation subunit (family B)